MEYGRLFQNLTEKQKQKLVAAKNAEELKTLLDLGGAEPTDDQLDAVAGGSFRPGDKLSPCCYAPFYSIVRHGEVVAGGFTCPCCGTFVSENEILDSNPELWREIEERKGSGSGSYRDM